jgi:CubicO group peptidase (beta-lactamase class C family)
MKNILILAMCLLSIFPNLSAQNKDFEIRMAVIKKVINGYNNYDYKAMKQPWVTWTKMFVTKNKLQKEFSAYYEKYGNASIDTVTFSSKYEYVVKLKMEKDIRTPRYFSFIFSENGKIEGFGETYPPLIFRKSVQSKSIDKSKFESEVTLLLTEKYIKNELMSFNGSLMILDNGKQIFKKNCGYADFLSKTKINDSTLFDLASISKQFTALAILLLEEKGKLQLSDSVQKFISDFPFQGISIKNLLTHTSGLPEYMGLMKKFWDKSKFASNYDVIEVIRKHKPKVLFSPNERFEYCNTNYVILSLIIENISGQSYAQFLKENIFNPLGMLQTRVYNTRRAKGEQIVNCSNGYVYSHESKKYISPDSSKKYEEVIYLDAITGDGNINSCLQDLLIWENELLEPKIINNGIIQKAMANHILKDGKLSNYGYGFFLTGGGNSEPLVYHTGGWPGYVCIVMNFFQQKKQIVILSNNSYENLTRMADDIATLLLY